MALIIPAREVGSIADDAHIYPISGDTAITMQYRGTRVNVRFAVTYFEMVLLK